uniref:Ribosomal protein S19 n=1 Tax=Ascaris lumbricoides TaxID=6252 RepID=A0A0M3HXW4_ASCLU
MPTRETARVFSERRGTSHCVKVPEWSDVTKMGISKELAPLNSDWYYVRTASIARRLYVRSPTRGRFSFGVSVLFLRLPTLSNSWIVLGVCQ